METKNERGSTEMKRYLAFLRGINISGKNKIPMAELKKGFETLAFGSVKTYLNSGNVVFSSEEDDIRTFTVQIEDMIQRQFGLAVPVFVISQEELEDILRRAPDWWGNDDQEIYDNLIFVMSPAVCADVFRELGEPKEGLETARDYKNAIFWSFKRKQYQKTNLWSRTASTDISANITIRLP